MNAEIKQLTELQIVDLEIAKLDEKMTAEQEALDKLRKGYQDHQDSITELQEKIAGIETRQRELEAEHGDELGRIKERQSKMMQVQTNREYQSLLKEIEDAKRGNKDREEESVRLMEQKESLEATLAEQISLSDGQDQELADEEKAMAKLVSELTSKKNTIEKKRTTKAKVVKAGLLKKYDMLRLRRNGRAVVGVTGGVCQGCFMSIPPQQYNEIMKGDKMLSCPTCNRILYYVAPPVEEVVEKPKKKAAKKKAPAKKAAAKKAPAKKAAAKKASAE